VGEVTPFTGGQVPAALAKDLAGDNTDLSSGVRGGYSVISIKGSRWGIKVDGETTVITNSDGDPVGSLKLVLLKASPNISKNYYPGGYVEGSTESPTCTSMDGITPNPQSEAVQAPSCAVCPQNVYGSRISDDGKKMKACSDSRRIAVIPEGDFKNEVYGGAMLLRIPAGSLTNLSVYGKKMKNVGFPYNTILTRCSFDTSVAHPKLEFNAVRPLTDDEANEIVALLAEPEFADKIEAILAKDLEIVPVDQRPAATETALFEDATATVPAAAPVTPLTPPVASAPAPAPTPVKPVASLGKEPAAEPETIVVADASDDELDSELKDILGSLDNLD